MRIRNLACLFCLMALSACRDESSSPPAGVLARVGGQEFTAAAAAEILYPQLQLPNETEVVEALTELWVDYFLLARTAMQDSTLQNLDVDLLVTQQINQERVMELRERVIQVDTALSEAELQEQLAEEVPGTRIRARHILMRVPEGATPAQKDSVRQALESLRNRIVAGEDFAALARQYSQDPGSGPAGGDLGTFGRGEMVADFERAAFALGKGELSPVVETPFGFHIIRVEEKEVPPLDTNRDELRAMVQSRKIMEAESAYVAGILEAAQLNVPKESYEVLRRLAAEPDLRLTRKAAKRPMVSYKGGALTVEEVQEWILTRDPALRSQIQAATDQQLDGLLRNIARVELLLNEAQAQGIEVRSSRRDSLATAIREGVASLARQLGFVGAAPYSGETVEEAANRVVLQLLREVVQQGREVYPLGGISVALRRQYRPQLFPANYSLVVQRVEDLRRQPPAPIPLRPGGEPGGSPPPDTSR